MNPRNFQRLTQLIFLSKKLAAQLRRLGRIYAENSTMYFSKAAILTDDNRSSRTLTGRTRKLYHYYMREGGKNHGKKVLVRKLLNKYRSSI